MPALHPSTLLVALLLAAGPLLTSHPSTTRGRGESHVAVAGHTWQARVTRGAATLLGALAVACACAGNTNAASARKSGGARAGDSRSSFASVSFNCAWQPCGSCNSDTGVRSHVLRVVSPMLPARGVELHDFSTHPCRPPRSGYTAPHPLPSPSRHSPASPPTSAVPLSQPSLSLPLVVTDPPAHASSTHSPSPAPSPSPTPSPTPSSHDMITTQIRRALTGEIPNSSSTASLSTVSTASVPSETREELFRHCLCATTIDVDELRRLVWAHGTPSAPWARSQAWKLFTAYLPPDRLDWHSHLANRRAWYWHLVHDLTIDPSARPQTGDHPLSHAADSLWREYFHDLRLRHAIHLDVLRTHPDLPRFAALRDNLERILFVYAKRHSQLQYVQGMNELAAPFLLAFHEGRATDLSDVEADAYHCFETIMSEMAPCYTPREPDARGMARQLRELQALLRIKDPVLENHFERLGIDPRFYGLRWIKLWLMREFCLADALALWDSFLTAEVRLPWIRYVCVAMAIRVRDQLLATDFAGCMKILLNYPDCDVAELLRIADRLRTSNVVIVRTARR